MRLDPRPEYQRARLEWGGVDGIPSARTTGAQASSRLMSMASANALLKLPPRSDLLNYLNEGFLVDALVIDEL